MRNNGILNIDVARADLPMQPEYWIEETYVSRYEKLLRVIEKKTSFLPYRVKLDANTLKRATGIFLRRLKLPHPKDYDKWIRYVLIDAYEECPDVFKQQYRAICKEDKETESNCIIRDALAYAELMCKGQAK